MHFACSILLNISFCFKFFHKNCVSVSQKLLWLTFSTGNTTFCCSGLLPVVLSPTSGWLHSRYLVVRETRWRPSPICRVEVFLLCVAVLLRSILCIPNFSKNTIRCLKSLAQNLKPATNFYFFFITELPESHFF